MPTSAGKSTALRSALFASGVNAAEVSDLQSRAAADFNLRKLHTFASGGLTI